MKTIPLTQGFVALVDDEDYEMVSRWSWHAEPRGNGVYARRCFLVRQRSSREYLHRTIMLPSPGEHVDHINGDPLDNRRANLRLCTVAQNLRNQRLSAANRSGAKGVYWDRLTGRWAAQLHVSGRKVWAGRHDDLVEAARAYDRAALHYFGPFARLNFPAEASS